MRYKQCNNDYKKTHRRTEQGGSRGCRKYTTTRNAIPYFSLVFEVLFLRFGRPSPGIGLNHDGGRAPYLCSLEGISPQTTKQSHGFPAAAPFEWYYMHSVHWSVGSSFENVNRDFRRHTKCEANMCEIDTVNASIICRVVQYLPQVSSTRRQAYQLRIFSRRRRTDKST